MGSKRRYYPAEDITVEFEPALCIHAAECAKGLPRVFDPQSRPWVDPSAAPADEIAKVVARCPSGALQYRRTDGGAEEVPVTENRVHVASDGPLQCVGDLRIVLPDGSIRHETRATLCRCGASANKPFCDNSHREMPFEDAALEMEDRLRQAEGEEEESALTIRLAANGPLLLQGPARLTCGGSSVSEGSKGALCRCGASAMKPYCDGAHKSNGFRAE